MQASLLIAGGEFRSVRRDGEARERQLAERVRLGRLRGARPDRDVGGCTVNSRDTLLSPEDFAFLTEEETNHDLWQVPVGMTLQDMERRMIMATLQHMRGNVKATAAALGIDRSTLYDKIHRYGIQRAPDEHAETGPGGT